MTTSTTVLTLERPVTVVSDKGDGTGALESPVAVGEGWGARVGPWYPVVIDGVWFSTSQSSYVEDFPDLPENRVVLCLTVSWSDNSGMTLAGAAELAATISSAYDAVRGETYVPIPSGEWKGDPILSFITPLDRLSEIDIKMNGGAVCFLGSDYAEFVSAPRRDVRFLIDKSYVRVFPF
jgi:hypothetical protein